jgi:hypothetical protein
MDGRKEGWADRKRGRQTDMKKVKVAFGNFANAPNKTILDIRNRFLPQREHAVLPLERPVGE